VRAYAKRGIGFFNLKIDRGSSERGEAF